MFFSSVRNTIKTILPFGAAAATAITTTKYLQQDQKKFTPKQVNQFMKGGKKIIGFNDQAYDVTNFVEQHPGGAEYINQANGHAVDNVWHQVFPIHLKNTLVAEKLKEMEIGKLQGELPQLDVESVKATERVMSGLKKHDDNNYEPEVLVFNDDYTTSLFYIRNHSTKNPQPGNLIIEYNNQQIILSNEQLARLPAKNIFLPVICGGAGRSHFKPKASGTPWGQLGDAVGTMRVREIPMQTILQYSCPDVLKTNFVMTAVGSDGYNAVYAKEELRRMGIAIQQADGSPIDEDHGGERRITGDGMPGFRLIKKLKTLKIADAPSEEEVDAALTERHKDPLKHLAPLQRMVLALCPKYDPYLIKSADGTKVLALPLYFMVSSMIHHIEQQGDKINISGFAYNGTQPISKVFVQVDKETPQPANITVPADGSGRFVFWQKQYALDANKMAVGDDMDITVDAHAGDKSQPDHVEFNPRGLGFPHQKARANFRI